MEKERNTVYEAIKEFEDALEMCTLLSDFLFGNKRFFNSCLEKIFLNLPIELKEKKDYLISETKDNVFSYMYQIQDIINSHTFLNNFVFLHTSKILSLIDSIYATLPNNMAFVKGKFQNNTEIASQIEIPNFLKKDEFI